MPRNVVLQPGRAYSFRYPRINYTGIPSYFETRHVLITAVRDLRRQPLDPETRQLNPLLRRGRWLVTGRDLDRGAERSFYAESMREVQPIDPDEQPLAGSTYAVIDRERVAFRTSTLGEALAFRQGTARGIVCGVLCDVLKQPRKKA